MKILRSILLLIFVSAVVCVPTRAHALTECDRAISSVKIEDPFWNQTDPIILITKDGKKLPLTFSFDTEIPDAEIYKRIYKDPELFADLKTATTGVPFIVSEALQTLKMSEKQFLSFALKKGATIKDGLFQLTDLYPRYISQIRPGMYLTVRQAMVTKWLNNLPIEVGKDGNQVEIRHNSFEMKPVQFKTIIETIHSKVERPQTHFHLGIPTEAVNDTEFLAIARTIETRAILRLAVEDPEPTQKLAYSVSYLHQENIVGKTDFGSRGVIKAQTKAFGGEIPAHDLELREWSTTEQAMGEIKLATSLAKNAAKLRILSPQQGFIYDDPYTQNLPGALFYAGQALSFAKDEKIVGVSKRLLDLASQMTVASGPTPAQRLEIAKVLEENKVLDLLDVEAWLHE